jgi:hypothetical protein
VSHHDVLARIKASIAEAPTGAAAVLLRQAAGSIEILLEDVARLDRELSWERTVEGPELERQRDVAYAALRAYGPRCSGDPCRALATRTVGVELSETLRFDACDSGACEDGYTVIGDTEHAGALRAAWEKR